MDIENLKAWKIAKFWSLKFLKFFNIENSQWIEWFLFDENVGFSSFMTEVPIL